MWWDAPEASAPPGVDAGADASDAPHADAGPDASPGPLPIRGSRLAPLFTESVDAAAGYRRYAGIYDTELDVVCYPTPAEDGKMRCLPLAAGSTVERFADAACTNALYAHPSYVCDKATFVETSTFDDSSCKTSARIYRVGALYTGTVYAKGAGGACAPLPTPEAGYEFYELTHLPAADFVEVTAAVDTVGGGIGEDVWAGGDGSRFSRGTLVDLARGEPCAPGFDVDGDVRCLPDPPGSIGGFTDAACTKHAFVVPETCEPPVPATAVQERAPGGGCYEQRSRVRALGAEVPTSAYHKPDGDGVCVPGDSSGKVLRELGAELPASTFPTLERRPPGAARLFHRDFDVGGVPLGYQYGLPHDQELGVDCFIVPTADGKSRCIPRAENAIFSDAECTVRATRESRDCWNDNAYAVSVDASADACTVPRWRVFSVSGSLGKGVPVWRKVDDVCVSFPIDPETTVLAVGDEVPLETFVEITEVVR